MGFVETVDLIHEEDGAGAAGGIPLRFTEDLADLLDAGEDGREKNEVGFGFPRDDVGQGGFAAAGRAPEDQRGKVVGLDHPPQDAPFAQQVLLPGELGHTAGSHALRQGGVCRNRLVLRIVAGGVPKGRCLHGPLRIRAGRAGCDGRPSLA